MLTSLTKENFWDELYKKHPAQVQVFCNWIDKYKERVRWNVLFNPAYSIFNHKGTIPAIAVLPNTPPKFHDLPLAMQFGIFLQFVAEQQSGNIDFQVEHPTDMEKIPGLVDEYFYYEHEDAKQEAESQDGQESEHNHPYSGTW